MKKQHTTTTITTKSGEAYVLEDRYRGVYEAMKDIDDLSVCSWIEYNTKVATVVIKKTEVESVIVRAWHETEEES